MPTPEELLRQRVEAAGGTWVEEPAAPYVSPGQMVPARPEGGLPAAPEIDVTNPYAANMEQWRSQAGGYFNSPEGPNNEPLPEGAQGWDWYGRPYYGDSWTGWWKELVSKWTTPFEDAEGATIATNWKETPASIIPTRWGAPLGTDLPEKIPAVDISKTWQNLLKGTAGAPIGYVSLAVDTVIKNLILPIFTGSAQKTKQTLGVIKEVGETAVETESPLGPSLLDTEDDFRRIILGAIPLVGWYEATRAVFSPEFRQNISAQLDTDALNDLKNGRVPFVRKGSAIDEAWQAGRILYSSLINPALEEEYIRRYREGENPYLLAYELENPIAEAVGELILDPLNFIGGWTRKSRDVARIANAADEYIRTGANLEDILSAARLEGLTDAQVVERTIDAARAQGNYVDLVKKGYDELAQRRGFFSLLATGAQFHISRRIGGVFNTLTGLAGGNPDDTAELLRIVYLATGTEDEIATAITAARKIKAPNMIFSRAGTELSITLRRMLGDSPGKFLDELKAASASGDVEKVIEFATKKLNLALKEFIPTTMEKIKLADAIASGKMANPADWQLALAQSVTPAMRRIAPFHEFLQTKAGVRLINNVLSGIYMGLSPAYAWRNAIQNFGQAVIDYGPGVAKHWLHPGFAKNGLREILGYEYKAVGFSSAAAIEGVKRWGAMKWSENIEAHSRTQIVYHQVVNSLRDMARPGKALPSVTPLIEKGLSPQAAESLWRLVISENFNVRRAASKFIEQYKTGSISALETLRWMKDRDAQFLQAVNKLDEVRDAIGEGRRLGDSVAQIQARLRAIGDDLLRQAAETTKEITLFPETSTDGGAILKAVEDLGDGEEARLASTYYRANEIAIDATEDALIKMPINEIHTPGITPEKAMKWSDFSKRVDAWTVVKSTAKRESDTFGDAWIAKHDAWLAQNKMGTLDISRAWAEMGLKSPAPNNFQDFNRGFWMEFFYPKRNQIWIGVRELGAQLAEEAARLAGREVAYLDHAIEANLIARKYDDIFMRYQEVRLAVANMLNKGDVKGAILAKANAYGIATKVEGGANLDQTVLTIINKNLPRGRPKFANLDDITDYEIANKAMAKYFSKSSITKTAGETVGGAGPVLPYLGDVPPSPNRVLYEQRVGIRELFERLIKGADDNFTIYYPVVQSPALTDDLLRWTDEAASRMADAKLVALQAGEAAADFALHSYLEKRGFDLVLSYLYPYQFWYTRTYAKWLKRIVEVPDVIAAYAKYKNTLAKIHAGAPEWWKYNVNSNELFGLDWENPLFFNLEATLNPLNGLTGVDFNDPQRRKNWWASMLDGMGKLGPSLWTPINAATAFVLYQQGEKDAAARWAGRLFPQSASIKAALTLMNVNLPDTPFTRGNEIDPFVVLFSGGLDPYEWRRVGRAGAMMEEEGYSKAAIQEALYLREGPLWDEMVRRAVLGPGNTRAVGQLASFFLGVGFKGRNTTDIQIDQFYNEFYALMGQREVFSPEEFPRIMNELREKYPFMDAILLANKWGPERDTAYAYSVINRIPPGQKTDLLKAAGITPTMVDEFYDNKGDMSKWSSTQRTKFMAAIIELGSVLEMPDDATRAEWTEASKRYQEMQKQAEKLFGKDALELMQAYYDMGGTTYLEQQARQQFMEANPVVQEVMNWIDGSILADDLLLAYYGSLNTVEYYYRGLMRTEIKATAGEDIYDLWTEYHALRDAGGDYKTFYKQHADQFEKYYIAKDKWDKLIAKMMAMTGGLLREGRQAIIRPDIEGGGAAQQALIEAAQREPTTLPWQDFKIMLSDPLERMVYDYVYTGRDFSARGRDQLEYIADRMNISLDKLLAMMEISLLQFMGLQRVEQ